MAVHQLSRRDARRIAVRAQLLDRPRPDSVLEVVRRLTMLQFEPTSAVAPSADVVLWSRLGSAYDRAELQDALDRQLLIELHGNIRPAEDLVLYRADMADWPGRGELREWQHEIQEWVEDNDLCRRDILTLLRTDGPLPTSALPDTCVRPWRSSGWTNNKNLSRMLDFLVQRGEVALAGRERRERLWDLASRIYPSDPPVPAEQARRARDDRRLRALGIARERGTELPGESVLVGQSGQAAVVDGVRGEWRVDPEQLERLGEPFRGRAALLSPLDRLVFDRKRVAELFEFDYQLEMYKPEAKRRWGFWAMPVLYGDRLVGKLDARAEPEEGELRVNALHWDIEPSATMRDAVSSQIDDLARWLGLERHG